MMSKGSKRLVNDHLALHRLLVQLQNALDQTDVGRTYSKLDLFWAKLAVHIRAEHLHLFPSILNFSENTKTALTPDIKEMQAVIDRLREDHDFFMHELAAAVLKARTMLNEGDTLIVESVLSDIRKTVDAVEQRLESHNEVEEKQVYLWVSGLLNQKEQEELAAAISTELKKRPARFVAGTW